MRVLFDTNVVLDVLLNREPHVIAASKLMTHVELGRIDGVIGATTVTTIHYLATKAVGPTLARKHLKALLSIFDVAPVDKATLTEALSMNFRDFEDAVLHEAGRRAGAEGIVTRDPAGFGKSTLRVYSPEELSRMIASLPPP